MEKINLGKYTITKSWDEVNLRQWQNYLRKLEDKGADKLDILSTLETFSDIPMNVIEQMPTPLFEKVVTHLKWLTEDVNEEPSNQVEIDGEIYQINYMEKLKIKEYLDLNTVMENDKFNYASIFAILCRKPNEEYNQDFIADKFSKRVEMFENMKVLDAMKLISFFLILFLKYETHSQNYLTVEEYKKELMELVRNIKDSFKVTDYFTPSKVRQILTLRKLEKSIKAI